MPTPPRDEQAGFAGGYNPNAGRVPSEVNQFSAMAFVRVLPSGEIAKAPGLKLLATPDGDSSLFPYAPVGGSGGVVSTSPGTIYSFAYAGRTAALTLTSRATGSVRHYSAAHFRDGTGECLYLASGTSKLSKYKGTTFSDRTIGLSLSLLRVWVYNQRLFGITGVDQTLYWSALNNGDTIGDSSLGGGSATIRTYGGQALVNGFALGATNVLQHSSALSKFVGLTFDDIAIQAGTQGVTANAGSMGFGSACVVDGVAYCVDRLGFYTLTEAGGVVRYESPGTPDPVRAFIDAWVASIDVRVVVAHNARANEIWVIVLGNRQTVSIYSLGMRRFTGQHSTTSGAAYGFTDMASVTDTDGAPQLLLADEQARIGGCDFRMAGDNIFTRFGTAYQSSVTCRRLFTGASLSEKAWEAAVVQAGSGAILGSTIGSNPVTQTVGTALDCHLSYTAPVGGTVSQTSVALTSDRVTRVPLSGSGEWVDLTISDDGTTTTGWSIAAVAVQASDLGLIGR